MSQKISIPFVGGFSTSRSLLVNNQATVNFMQAVKGGGAKKEYILESTPGLVDLGNIGTGPIRSPKMINSNIRGQGEELFGVYGTKLMAQTVSQGNIEIGDLAASSNKVVMARGRNYVAMVDGAKGYTYDGTTFAEIADLDFPDNPTHIIYLDGFFIVNDADTDNFYISAKEDPTSWNALDFEAAAVAPDNALALAATESILWIVGEESTQGYYNSGNPDFPYSIILSATQEVGILAPYSIAESDDGIFFLATTPEGGRFVYRIQGQSGKVITEDEQEHFLTTVADPSDAYGFIYKQSGKSFYVLQLSETEGADARTSATLVYNIGAGKWETRELLDGSAWRAGGHGILNKQNIVGSRLQNKSLRLDLNVFTDAGQPIVKRRRTQIFHKDNHLLDWIELIIDIGPATTEDLELDPLIKLRYSDDGGRSWGYWLTESLGRIGDFEHRVVFRSLGISRNRVYEIEISEAIYISLIGAYAVIDILRD